MCIKETFKDFYSGFGLDAVQIASARRLGGLVAALSLALAWLHILAQPQTCLLPRGWAASIVTTGRASRVSFALALLDYLLACSPKALPWPALRSEPFPQAA